MSLIAQTPATCSPETFSHCISSSTTTPPSSFSATSWPSRNSVIGLDPATYINTPSSFSTSCSSALLLQLDLGDARAIALDLQHARLAPMFDVRCSEQSLRMLVVRLWVGLRDPH